MSARRVGIALLLIASLASCRHPEVTRTEVVPTNWSHCWWTVIRSTLPADTVASRFRRALITVGLPGFKWTRSVDTVWLRAGPAPVMRDGVDISQSAGSYWARAVVLPHGDSTHFRMYIAVVPPARGWKTAADSSSAAGMFTACEAIARESGVKWLRRAGDPGAEENLPVWSRVP